MKTLHVVLLVCACVVVYAQKSPIKFGDIPMADMTMKVYPQDTSAAAVVLEDFGVAFINSTSAGVQLNFERHVRIKILKKEGLEWANASIRTFHNGDSEEKISNLKAASYNLENGKIVESKLSKDGIFREKVNKNNDRQKFTIPNAKEGSVVEYSYHLISEFYTSFPNWQFQRTIPTRYSEYWAMIPDLFDYQKYMQGYVPITTYEEKKSMSYYNVNVNGYHYICKDVPAFRDEPYMTTEDDFVSKLNFALAYINYSTHSEEVMGTWQKLNDKLLESEAFGDVLNGSGFLKDKVGEITAGITDPLKKIEAISNYVKQNVEYDGDEDFEAYPLRKVLEKKKGTAGDVNLLFASMLQKAGFEVDMVLLSTRDHGFVRPQFPMKKQFNYVICAVRLEGGKSLLVDATEKYLPYDVIPARCLNGQGLVISKTRHGWMEITAKAKAKTIVNAQLKLNEEGQLNGKITYAREGYDAQAMRESYNKAGESNYVEAYTKSKQWQVAKSEFQDIADVNKQAKEVHEVSIVEHTSAGGDVIYLNPFVTAQMEANPFKSETRVYPVDYGSQQESIYLMQLTIPDGFVVDEIPQPKIFSMPGNAARYLYSATQIGNVINFNSTFQVNKNTFSQAEYPILREFYNQVVAKQAEQIVLKKKS